MFNAMAITYESDHWNIPVKTDQQIASSANGTKESSAESDEQNSPQLQTGQKLKLSSEKLSIFFEKPTIENTPTKFEKDRRWKNTAHNLDEVEACIEALTNSFSDDCINLDLEVKKKSANKDWKCLQIKEGAISNCLQKLNALHIEEKPEEVIKTARMKTTTVHSSLVETNGKIYANAQKLLKEKTWKEKLQESQQKAAASHVIAEAIRDKMKEEVDSVPLLPTKKSKQEINSSNPKKLTCSHNSSCLGARPREARTNSEVQSNHVIKIRCNIAPDNKVSVHSKIRNNFSSSFTAASNKYTKPGEIRPNSNCSPRLSCPKDLQQLSVQKHQRKHKRHNKVDLVCNENSSCKNLDNEVIAPKRSLQRKGRRDAEESGAKERIRNGNAKRHDEAKSSVSNIPKTLQNNRLLEPEPRIFHQSPGKQSRSHFSCVPDLVKVDLDSVQKRMEVTSICAEKGQLWPMSYEILAPELVQLRARLDGGVLQKTDDGVIDDEVDALEINKLLMQLETAIAAGMKEKASQLAKKLAEVKVNCSVVSKKRHTSTEKITINLFVEDRTSHIGPIELQINPSMTVGLLKRKIEQEFDFPTCFQKWIIGKKLAMDDSASISSFEIKANGCAVFLYLTVNDPIIADLYKRKLEGYLKAIEEFNAHSIAVPPREKMVQNFTASFNMEIIRENVESEIPQRRVAPIDYTVEGWTCPRCTLINPSNRPGCSACTTNRPNKQIEKTPQILKEIEEQEKEQQEYRIKNYQHLIALDNLHVVSNEEVFECSICFSEVQKGEGILIRECLHSFCKDCVANTIQYSETAEVKCPYRDNAYSCPATLQDREIRALVAPEIYDKHLLKSMITAENQAENSFHCKSADCHGWCFYDDNINEFLCPVCQHKNCLTCQAQHEGTNCRQFQDMLEFESSSNEDARKTKEALNTMLDKGEAMRCPKCQVILMKKWGCDWLKCTMCQTEICWVTKGARWGPAGKGDTSAGCRCGINGIRCHALCNYCH